MDKVKSKEYKRALVVLSGGQDSTTCLFLARELADEVVAITFDYGQRHSAEIDAAFFVACAAGLTPEQRETITLPQGVLAGSSPLVDPLEVVESYADADALPGGIEKTFVPMRNALFLTLAANRAIVLGCDVILTGISEEDYGGYPDCRAEFLVAMQGMIRSAIAESSPVPELVAPLLHIDKAGTVDMARLLPGCMEALAYTHTCYKGVFPPCGTCHACLLRARGFERAGVPDPLVQRAEQSDGGVYLEGLGKVEGADSPDRVTTKRSKK